MKAPLTARDEQGEATHGQVQRAHEENEGLMTGWLADPAAAFNLNGSRVGVLTEFLDRDVAFDHVPGKPVEVWGATAQGSGRLD